jgi:hypothetical protein
VKKIPVSVFDRSNGQSSGITDFHTNPFSASIGVFLSLAAETPPVAGTVLKGSDWGLEFSSRSAVDARYSVAQPVKTQAIIVMVSTVINAFIMYSFR